MMCVHTCVCMHMHVHFAVKKMPKCVLFLSVVCVCGSYVSDICYMISGKLLLKFCLFVLLLR